MSQSASSEPGTTRTTPAASASHRPSPWLLLRTFVVLGLQSFGGGPAMLFLMRRTVVERRGWLSDEAFTRAYAICQITPGINLVALTILIGWRLGGPVGMLVSLGGMLLPSAGVTVLLTALYTRFQQNELIEAALNGIIPATIGLTLLLALAMARQVLGESRRQGWGSLLLACLLIVASALLVGMGYLSVIAVFLLAGGIGALAGWWRTRHTDHEKHAA